MPTGSVEARETPLAAREARSAVGTRRLGVLVFVAGGATLSTEIAASRLLAPYFGSSTVVWANIIGLILLYLSVGYWLGGRLADRRPDPALLGRLVLVAAFFVAATPVLARPVLDRALHGFASLSVGIVVGSFLAAVALFAIPVTLLGTVAPFALRLALADVAEAGRVSGRLYALSTVGSILGTFLAALVAIPLLGTRRTMMATAALLALAAVLVLGRRWVLAAVPLVVLLVLPTGAVKASPGLLFERESPYQYVQVVRAADGSRRLELNEGVAVHSVWRRNTVLTGGYWDLFLVLPPLLDPPARTMLVIGNAGGTVARAYGRLYPGVAIDGVEIDPVVTEAGRRFLGLGDNARLRVITADGRPYLERTRRRYDLIVVDAYHQPYVPFYLATKEFFALARRHLNPGGAIALNVATVPGSRRLSDAIASTLLSVFPQVWRWPALRFNDLVVGLDRPLRRGEVLARAATMPAPALPLFPLLARELQRARATTGPLTDDRAPVEWLTDRMLVDQIATGRGLDERSLPTAP